MIDQSPARWKTTPARPVTMNNQPKIVTSNGRFMTSKL
jgi:hypothetical protein